MCKVSIKLLNRILDFLFTVLFISNDKREFLENIHENIGSQMKSGTDQKDGESVSAENTFYCFTCSNECQTYGWQYCKLYYSFYAPAEPLSYNPR